MTTAIRTRMKVSLGIPVDRVDAGDEFASASGIASLARSYEQLGFDAAYVTDHPAPDDRWLAAGGHQAMEPTVALAVAATVTADLLVHTNVYVAPYRNPFLSAKALASLDVVSSGRLIVGVAAGYLRPEFAALGADFESRGARLDEALELWPRIWSEGSLAADGASFAAKSVTALPAPVQRPGPPIWVGGNSTAAMRRAVRFGDGWSPFPTPEGAAAALRTAAITDAMSLARRIDRLTELSEEAGRDHRPIVCFVPFSLAGFLADPAAGLAPLAEEIEQLGEIGVDWVALSLPGDTRVEVVEHATRVAEQLGLQERPTG